MESLRGLSAFTLTPFAADTGVDLALLQELVARLATTGVASIGVLGSTGSYMYLDRDDRARVLSAAVEASGGKPILAGIGDLRSDWVIENARAAEKAGAAALLLAPVSYLPLIDADFAALVRFVAAQTHTPICLYNNPGTTHFTISDALVAELAKVESVAAVKHPAPPKGLARGALAALRADLPEGFVLGFSGDAQIAGVLGAGPDAWYSVVAGVLPNLAQDLWAAREDVAALGALETRHKALWRLFVAHGSIRVCAEIAQLIGLGNLALPLPLRPLAPPVVEEIARALDVLEVSTECA